jgi:hypothetical protein
MLGKLWIERNSFQWVKAEVEVVHPVHIGGFIARVEPGTRFELEKIPVSSNIWLPSHLVVKSRSIVLRYAIPAIVPKQQRSKRLSFQLSCRLASWTHALLEIKSGSCRPDSSWRVRARAFSSAEHQIEMIPESLLYRS